MVTLDQNFNRLKETMVSFNKEEIKSFLFEYAAKVIEIEKINSTEFKEEGYLEFLMQEKFDEIVERFFFVSKHAKNPENLSYNVPVIDRELSRYFFNPLNRYNYEQFKEIKDNPLIYQSD